MIAPLLRSSRFAWWRLRCAAHGAFLRLAYPGLTLGRRCYVDPSVTLRVAPGARMIIGDDVHIAYGAFVVAESGTLVIGANGYIGFGAVIVAFEQVSIGRDALLSQYVTIRDQDHGTSDATVPYRLQLPVVAPVSIGENVWLGSKASVMKGVTIGDNTIVGANAVVTRDLPRGATAVGIPARVIVQRETDTLAVRGQIGIQK